MPPSLLLLLVAWLHRRAATESPSQGMSRKLQPLLLGVQPVGAP